MHIMEKTQKHGGSWKLFEKDNLFQGELHINYDNHVIALEILIPASKGVPIPRPPYKGKIPYICGTLFSGAKILLFDCCTGQESTKVMSYTQQIIYAKYAFWGLHVDSKDEIIFSQVKFDFGEIIRWSGLCNYRWEFLADGDSCLEWIHKDPVKYTLSENLEITLYPDRENKWGNLYDKEISATQSIKVEFNYKTPTTWESIMEDVKCIQYLIGLGINQKIAIYEVQYYHSSIYLELPKEDGTNEKIYTPADTIIGSGETNPTYDTKFYDYLYTLDDFIKNDSFAKWSKNYSTLKPILDLYFIAFSNSNVTPEMLFLNLTQALETYHARFVTDNVKKYIARVAELVKPYPPGGKIQSQWENFLFAEGQKSANKIYLKSRLADLIFADGNLPFWPQGLTLDLYISKIVDTRNYYTHYNPAKLDKAFSKSELLKVNGHLKSLLEYHILTLIGFDLEEVRKKTVKRIDQIDNSYHIQEKTHEIEVK